MNNRLKRRVEMLENHRGNQSSNRVLTYDPDVPGSLEKILQSGLKGKYMIVPSYSSDEKWEKGLLKQQSMLQSKDRKG